MTKYKAGTITAKITDSQARVLERDNVIIIHADNIISHDPAPEPIVRYYIVGGLGFDDIEIAKDVLYERYSNDFCIIKTTRTGNDFTVEKVTE